MTYSASSAKASVGTVFTWNSTTPQEITSIDGPSVTNDEINVSNFNSGVFKEFLVGMSDPGQITLNMNYIAGDAGQIGMIADAIANPKTLRTWTLDFPTVGQFSGSGYMLSFKPAASVGNQVTMSATIRVSGTITPSST